MDTSGSVNIMATMAERKILEAMEEGQFDNLPGCGSPQKLEDLSHLPPDMRLAYIVMKNNGFLNDDENEAMPFRPYAALPKTEGINKRERLSYLLAELREAEKSPKEQRPSPGLVAAFIKKILRD